MGNENAMLSDSIYMKVLKKQNNKDGSQVTGCQGLHIFSKSHQIIYLKRVTILICKSCINKVGINLKVTENTD